MTSRRRLPSAVAAAPVDVLEDDDLLGQILLRLPPRPSSLPRASLVCKRWRRFVSDPHFLRSFRAHHRNLPLLGFFHCNNRRIVFTPALDSSDRIPAARFSLRLDDGINCDIRSCRHGRVLVTSWKWPHFLVWEPVTRNQHRVPFPSVFCGNEKHVRTGAVVCAAIDRGHVHGACHSNPFKVILIGCSHERIYASVYSSETGAWSDAVSILWPQHTQIVSRDCPNILLGNSVCWLLYGRRAAVLSFDLYRQRLAAIEVPSNAFDIDEFNLGAFFHLERRFLIAPADSGGLCFLALSDFSAQLWKMEASSSDGVSRWTLKNTIKLDHLLSLSSGVGSKPLKIHAFAEDDNVMFLRTDIAVFMVHLDSMQFKKFSERRVGHQLHHPFISFYSLGLPSSS